ncbi:MAG: response regulator [Betaproteobacteria bacterium]|nr:MAG: response regulator [Betaproteobacteria bacterium]
MRVIVIEDDEHFRSLTVRWLQSYGIEAEGAAHGARGLALQRQRPADVIVTDIFMPEREGIETINDLRKEFPEAKIIAMSGRDPFKFEELVAAVRELAEASSGQQSRIA